MIIDVTPSNGLTNELAHKIGENRTRKDKREEKHRGIELQDKKQTNTQLPLT